MKLKCTVSANIPPEGVICFNRVKHISKKVAHTAGIILNKKSYVFTYRLYNTHFPLIKGAI